MTEPINVIRWIENSPVLDNVIENADAEGLPVIDRMIYHSWSYLDPQFGPCVEGSRKLQYEYGAPNIVNNYQGNWTRSDNEPVFPLLKGNSLKRSSIVIKGRVVLASCYLQQNQAFNIVGNFENIPTPAFIGGGTAFSPVVRWKILVMRTRADYDDVTFAQQLSNNNTPWDNFGISVNQNVGQVVREVSGTVSNSKQDVEFEIILKDKYIKQEFTFLQENNADPATFPRITHGGLFLFFVTEARTQNANAVNCRINTASLYNCTVKTKYEDIN